MPEQIPGELELNYYTAAIQVRTFGGTSVALFDDDGDLVALGRFAPDSALTPVEHARISELARLYHDIRKGR